MTTIPRYADPRTSTDELLARINELSLRSLLSELPPAKQAKLAAAVGEMPPPLTAVEHLELLQLEWWVECRMRHGRQCRVHRARAAGADWGEIAEVLQTDVVTVRDDFAAWVDGQQQLHDDIGVGLDDDQAAAAWALLEDC